MTKKPGKDISPNVTVIAEGKDEWGRRYFRLGVNGEPINFPPVLASRLIRNKNEVLAELANAGVGLFTPLAQKQLFESVQKWGKKQPRFKVATRIGWNGGNLCSA